MSVAKIPATANSSENFETFTLASNATESTFPALALGNRQVASRPSQSGSPTTFYLGDFTIKLTAIIGPAIGTAVGAWLHARYGRKVRLKVGEIEAEAQTREEVEKLLARAQEIQQRNQPPKVIP